MNTTNANGRGATCAARVVGTGVIVAKGNENANVDATSGATISADECAARIGTDGKSLRRWLRKRNGGTLPRGARYAIRVADVERIASAYGAEGGGSATRVVFDVDATGK